MEYRRMIWQLVLLLFLTASLPVDADESFEQRSARKRQEFWQKVHEKKRARAATQQMETQVQKNAARSMSVTPSQCALAFNTTVARARSFNDLRSFFTRHYLATYVGLNEDPAKELAQLKRNYMHECRVRGKGKIESDGEANVTLEGYTSSAKKRGTRVNLRMLPEDNYWRIDGYRAESGLTVFSW